MNPRHGRPEIFPNSPDQPSSRNSRYDTALTALQNNNVLGYLFVAVISIPILLGYLRFVPVSLLHMFWDLLVYLTPSRIVIALDPGTSKSDRESTSSAHLTPHEKSDAMKRILRLDNDEHFLSFSRSRSVSIFGNTVLGSARDATPPGLGNWNNSCFQNSVMQGLASLKSLTEFLSHNIDSFSGKASVSTHTALLDLLDSLNSANKSGTKLWVAGPLKFMSSWQQQDAQEYFSKLIDQIDFEAEKGSRGQTLNLGLKIAGPEENIFRDRENDGDECMSGELESLPSTDKLYLDMALSCNPLEGLLAQRVGCMNCGWTEGLSLIPFNCLTVPLGRNPAYDVRECLDQYMALEPIDGVECTKCTLLHQQEQLAALIRGFEETEGQPTGNAQAMSAVKESACSRLEAVEAALKNNDFSDTTLKEKCCIPSKNRISTTKSRQAVIARAPRCLAIHVNRSVFNEMTGALEKNLAAVTFPQTLNLNDWCLGIKAPCESSDDSEKWETNPSQSMLPRGQSVEVPSRQYQLRAIITHYGRHENGHYICYRKYPTSEFSAPAPDEILQAERDKDEPERWWRLSDDDVQMVSEDHVLSQGGAFMLFYEAIDDSISLRSSQVSTPESELAEAYYPASGYPTDADSFCNSSISNAISTSSTVTDSESSTSRATSVSTQSENFDPATPPLKASNVLDADVPADDRLDSRSTIIA
jgi:ubiquitin carboxyl-terminal hydrolase 1